MPQDGKKIIGYRKAMTLDKQPKKMIVVGSGAIGVEFAHFYNTMGTEVTIVEYIKNRSSRRRGYLEAIRTPMKKSVLKS